MNCGIMSAARADRRTSPAGIGAHKCQCLFFTNRGTYNYCPANDFGGPHATGGFAYSVLYNDAVARLFAAELVVVRPVPGAFLFL